jgi:hypothetical protein
VSNANETNDTEQAKDVGAGNSKSDVQVDGEQVEAVVVVKEEIIQVETETITEGAHLTPVPRDAANWAASATSLRVTRVPTGALNLNVEGLDAVSPLQGFGQMWQKVFRVRLKGLEITPEEVMKEWKANFPKFWPKGNRFYAPLTGIAPGEVVLIKMAMPGGLPLSTGVIILYADEVSFTVMTPQGHIFAGWNTFSAYEEDGHTIAQAHVLIRPSDPMYEIGYHLGAGWMEDRFWVSTVRSLAKYLGMSEPEVTKQIECIDRRWQWAYFGNLWHNSFIRTTIYLIGTPVRWVLRRGKRKAA